MYCFQVSIVHCYMLIKHWVLNSFTDISYDKMNHKAHINLFKLTKLTETDDSTIELCKEFGLFPKEIKCPNCNDILDKVYKVKNRTTNIFRYQCNKRECRKKGKNTLRANTCVTVYLHSHHSTPIGPIQNFILDPFIRATRPDYRHPSFTSTIPD